jgi:hypothetical protein
VLLHGTCVKYSSYKIVTQDNFVTSYLHGVHHGQTEPHTFCLVMKFGFFSVDMWTFKIASTGLQNMQCLSTKCHYIALKLVCGML